MIHVLVDSNIFQWMKNLFSHLLSAGPLIIFAILCGLRLRGNATTATADDPRRRGHQVGFVVVHVHLLRSFLNSTTSGVSALKISK